MTKQLLQFPRSTVQGLYNCSPLTSPSRASLVLTSGPSRNPGVLAPTSTLDLLTAFFRLNKGRSNATAARVTFAPPSRFTKCRLFERGTSEVCGSAKNSSSGRFGDSGVLGFGMGMSVVTARGRVRDLPTSGKYEVFGRAWWSRVGGCRSGVTARCSSGL